MAFENSDATARIIYGVITGIGFVGGGAIIKDHGNVSGTATAASIWNTGALGVSVAMELYDIAIMLCVLNVLTLVVFRHLKKDFHLKDQDD